MEHPMSQLKEAASGPYGPDFKLGVKIYGKIAVRIYGKIAIKDAAIFPSLLTEQCYFGNCLAVLHFITLLLWHCGNH